MIKIETFSPTLKTWTELGMWRAGDRRGALNAALGNCGHAESIRLTEGDMVDVYSWGRAIATQLKEGDVITIRVKRWKSQRVDRTATYVLQTAVHAFDKFEGDLQFLDGDQEQSEGVRLRAADFDQGTVEIQEVDRFQGILPLR